MEIVDDMMVSVQLLEIEISLSWLSGIAVFFAVTIVGFLSFIGIYILRELRNKARCRHLVNIYSNFIGDIILSEDEEELLQVLQQPYVQTILRHWITRTLGRRVLIEQLVQNHKSLTGKAGENIIWLYNHLRLNEDSLSCLSSSQWHQKASAMQELAEMKQKQYITRLYRETNSKVYIVRAEAQIAVVKLSGFAGLRFLDVISQQITQWQQLCLLNQLPAPVESQCPKVKNWLASSNNTIVEFTLRLIAKFQLIDFHDLVGDCLLHRSSEVRRQCTETLRVISTDTTPQLLIERFPHLEKEEQLSVLNILGEAGTVRELPFLEAVVLTSIGIKKKIAEIAGLRIRETTAVLDLASGAKPGLSDGNNLKVVA